MLLVMMMPSGVGSHCTVEAGRRPGVDVAGAGSSCRAEADRRPITDVAGAGSNRWAEADRRPSSDAGLTLGQVLLSAN